MKHAYAVQNAGWWFAEEDRVGCGECIVRGMKFYRLTNIPIEIYVKNSRPTGSAYVLLDIFT